MATKELDKTKIHGVICYWQYEAPPPDSRPFAKIWKLVEAYPIDMDGYPLVKVKHSGSINSRQEWDNWMNTKSDENEDDDYDYKPTMGRAVTIWSIESGVRLLDLHPPEWVSWLSVSFLEELREQQNWAQMLECGHDLYLGTARAAKKILFK